MLRTYSTDFEHGLKAAVVQSNTQRNWSIYNQEVNAIKDRSDMLMREYNHYLNGQMETISNTINLFKMLKRFANDCRKDAEEFRIKYNQANEKMVTRRANKTRKTRRSRRNRP